MKDTQKSLTPQEKATFIANADISYSDSVKALRKKMIQENYLTSATQIQMLDKLLWGVKEAENSTISKALFDNLVKSKQITFIYNLIELFKEGWLMSKAFRFYTGNGPVKELNTWKLRKIIEVIEKKDRTDFAKFEADLDKKKIPAPKKPFKKKTPAVNEKSVPVVTTKPAYKEIPVSKK